MKVLVQIVMAIWAWTILMVVVGARAELPLVSTEEPHMISYNTETLDTNDAESYSTVLTSLRGQLKGSDQCQLQVTRKTVADNQRFVLVEVISGSRTAVTLAIDVTNVYVVGYSDKYQGKDRANFLKDAPKVAKDNLFKGATVRDIGFGGNYEDLERAAKQRRSSIELGILKLGFAVESVFGKDWDKMTWETEAKFFLVSIQMVAEATRFKYIENMVVEKGLYGSFKPDPKVLSLEKNWDGISTGIHKSAGIQPKCVDINPPVTLRDANDQIWLVSKVKDIAPDVALLKYPDSKLATIYALFTYFTDQ